MTPTIKTLLTLGFVAAVAAPAFAAVDVERDPVASGRYFAGTPDPVANAYAKSRPAMTRHTVKQDRRWIEWLLNERNVGRIP